MIKEIETYHGVFFARLLRASTHPILLSKLQDRSGASYVVEGKKKAGLYIKHSTKRLPPWRFTFMEEHQTEIQDMRQSIGAIFLVLVCGQDGVISLAYEELKSILDENHEPVEWISVHRGKRRMYTVKGKDGQLSSKVPRDFHTKILNHIGVAKRQGNVFRLFSR